MSTVATKSNSEVDLAYQKTGTLPIEGMFDEEHSQDIWQNYLPAYVPSSLVVHGIGDSENADANYVESKVIQRSSTLEDELKSDDPLNQYIADFNEMLAKTKITFQSYEYRIEELHKFALDDEECSEINESSRKDFWCFVKSMPWTSTAGLMLLDNGNLSAVWRLANNTRIEVEFFGNGWCNFVKLKRHGRATRASHKLGVCRLDELSTELYE